MTQNKKKYVAPSVESTVNSKLTTNGTESLGLPADGKEPNKARCKLCGDIIESKHRHDFKYCKCKAIFVDGGFDYQRIGGNLSAMELWRKGEWVSFNELKKNQDEYSFEKYSIKYKTRASNLVKICEHDELEIDKVDYCINENKVYMVLVPKFLMSVDLDTLNKIAYEADTSNIIVNIENNYMVIDIELEEYKNE